MNLSTRQLRAFLQVARTGNFTRAAERVHMTQAGLSILVREVEKQLGVRLFDRTTRSAELTDAGKRFAVVAQSVLQQLDDASAEVDTMGQKQRQQLRVAAPPLIASHLLPQALAQFRNDHPQVRIQLMDGSLTEVESLVESNAADIGLGFFFKGSTGLVRRHVGDFQLMKVSPAQTLPSRMGRANWSTLNGQRLITLQTDNPIQRSISAHLAKAGVAVDDGFSVNFIATIISMVEAGFGTAVLPSFALGACRRHQVQVSLMNAPQLKLGLYSVSRRGAAPNGPAADFNEFLARHVPVAARSAW